MNTLCIICKQKTLGFISGYLLCPNCFHLQKVTSSLEPHIMLHDVIIEDSIQTLIITNGPFGITLNSDLSILYIQLSAMGQINFQTNHKLNTIVCRNIYSPSLLIVCKSLLSPKGLLLIDTPKFHVNSLYAKQLFNTNSMKLFCESNDMYLNRVAVSKDKSRYLFYIQQFQVNNEYNNTIEALYNELVCNVYSDEYYINVMLIVNLLI